ncbi:HPP family protein [Haloprofundus halobius]|uniref:HPP family protein n=1 Tax=Haloprofundus halobius TaxID=2876194 RepID=UPI001CCCB9B3|nr:HPP family protein [Haloprofundus halobius]
MDDPRDRVLPATLHAAALMTVLGAVALLTGRSFLFPSLGPSAYVLATGIGDADSAPKRVVGGHVIGVLAGMATYHLLASGIVVLQIHEPLSAAGIRLAASATVAVGATTAGMLATDLRHPPACATTLIVSLGLLTQVGEALAIVIAVLLLVAVQRILVRGRRTASTGDRANESVAEDRVRRSETEHD